MMNVADYQDVGLHAEIETLDVGAEPTLLEVPANWHTRYTDADKTDVASVVAWLNRTAKPQSWLAKVSRTNAGTLNQVLRGTYTSPVGKFLSSMLDAMRVHDERAGQRGVPFVEGSVWNLAGSIYHRARTYRNFGVFAGFVGTGKTRSAKEYARRTPNVYFIECYKGMGGIDLLDELLEKLNLEVESSGAGKGKKLKMIERSLKGTDSLIIVDEAETIQPDALHFIRRIRDIANIGVVLQGTEMLLPMVKAERGRFGQIRSRVGFWPATVHAIERTDCDEIALAAFDDLETPPDAETLDAIWSVCGGSARMLVENLIPALRDYGLRRARPLNVTLVRQVATQVLQMSIPAKGKAS
jgi:hypothetical protein